MYSFSFFLFSFLQLYVWLCKLLTHGTKIGVFGDSPILQHFCMVWPLWLLKIDGVVELMLLT